MVERVLLPEGLEAMPPGPDLAALLDSVELSRVNGFDAIRVVEAAARQIAHTEAVLLAAVAAVPRRLDGDADAPAVHVPADADRLQAAVDEVGWALHQTTASAGRLAMLAETAVVDHPALHAALDTGALDVPRVRVIADAVGVLDHDSAAAVIAKILPQAPELTTGQLRQKLARLVLKVDPTAAAARRKRAIADRRVERYADHDGTATISALGLPVERAAAAMHRLDTLATGVKQRGDERTLNQLRADLMLDLIVGNAVHGDPGGRGDSAGHGDSSVPGDSAGHGDSSVPGDPSVHGGDDLPGAPPPPWRWAGGLTLTASLETLLGLAEDPAHLDGWGPLAAEVIHQLGLSEMKERRYRFRIHDDTGEFIDEVTARHRFPTAAQRRHVLARDKTCRAPGCRVPAHRSDIDHTIDYAKGGPTTVDNLGPFCKRNHIGKHERGFAVEQPRPGHFIWTTPHGHTYCRGPDSDADPP